MLTRCRLFTSLLILRSSCAEEQDAPLMVFVRQRANRNDVDALKNQMRARWWLYVSALIGTTLARYYVGSVQNGGVPQICGALPQKWKITTLTFYCGTIRVSDGVTYYTDTLWGPLFAGKKQSAPFTATQIILYLITLTMIWYLSIQHKNTALLVAL